MDTTLISEGIESLPKDGEDSEGWKFYTAANAKVCSTPQGRFIAEQHGTLHFWPTRQAGLDTELDPEPHISHPVPQQLVDQFVQGITGTTPDQVGAAIEPTADTPMSSESTSEEVTSGRWAGRLGKPPKGRACRPR